MGSILRAIAAAIRSWFRSPGTRNDYDDRHRADECRRREKEEARAAAEAEQARRRGEEEARATAERGAQRQADEAQRREEEEARAAAGAEEARRAEDEVRAATEREALRRSDEAQRREEEEAPAAAAEAEQARRAAEKEARATAELEAQRQADEVRRREEEEAHAAAEAAEVEARTAAEREAQRQTDEGRRREEEEARAAAAEAEQARRAEEEAHAAADREAQRQADENEHTHLAAEAEALQHAEEAARAAAEAEAQCKAEEEERSRVTAENEVCRQSESEADVEPRPPADDGPARATEEEVESEEDGEDAIEEPAEPAAQRAQRTRAPRYRGPAGGPPAPKQTSSTTRTVAARTEPVPGGNHDLPVELRVLFERGDSLRVTLLPRRSPGLPDELTVWTPSGTIDLVALQEDWYQDVAPQNLDTLLSEGVLWRDEATGQEWLLSGRDVFVLTAGTEHRGLVSCPRLVLGREHAVLCATPRLAAVEAVLREAGCEGWRLLDDNDGAPLGWVLLRDVLPRRPVSWTGNSDILNALRPLPQIEIAFEGGICLGYATWLAEHPPSIRVYGDPEHMGAVQIDGQTAIASGDGCFTSPGWDSAGTHQVWCNGATKRYSLVRREPPSQSWAAISFPSPGTRGSGRLAICGPLVRAFTDPQADDEEAATSEVIQVPPANPVLVGSLPGQVIVTHPRPDVRGAQCIVSSPFAPVWALPAQPLLCDKNANRVLLVGDPVAPGEGSEDFDTARFRTSIHRWCSVIRDAGRKGLAVEPATPAVADLWRRYRRYARDLWRRSR